MNKIQIIGAIMLATSKYVPDFALENNIPKKTFYRVIKGQSGNLVVRKLIASIINKPISEIWPEPAKEKGV